MKKLSTLILMSLALFLLGCEGTDDRDTNPYDLGYEEGGIAGYKEGEEAGFEAGYNQALLDSLEYVRDNYSIGEVYESDEILDYVRECYDIESVYNLDTLIDYLEDSDYAVIPVEDYNDSVNSPDKSIEENKEQNSDFQTSNTLSYIGNKNTKKFHKSTCSSVNDIKESNKVYESRDYFIEHGYDPCKKCNP